MIESRNIIISYLEECKFILEGVVILKKDKRGK